jgi:hypothetical protein
VTRQARTPGPVDPIDRWNNRSAPASIPTTLDDPSGGFVRQGAPCLPASRALRWAGRLNRDIPKGPDVVARSNVAWQILDHKTRTIAMRPGTAWMRTVALLAEGSDEGLARTRELSIERLIVVCERLIKGPYTKLTKSGGAMRW